MVLSPTIIITDLLSKALLPIPVSDNINAHHLMPREVDLTSNLVNITKRTQENNINTVFSTFFHSVIVLSNQFIEVTT